MRRSAPTRSPAAAQRPSRSPVPGSEAVAASWRAALMSDRHGLPVIAIRGGRVHETTAAARALFGELPADAPFDDLFDERTRAKMRAFLAEGTSGRAVEVAVGHGDTPPTTVKFLILDAPGEQLLVGQRGAGYTEGVAEKIITAHAHLANAMRELAKAKDTEQRLHAELEALGQASSAVVEAVADLPSADVSTVLRMIALQAQTLTQADYVALGIGDDPERPFQHWVVVGMSQDVARKIGRVPRPVGVLGRVACKGEIVRMAERRDGRFGALPEDHPELGAFLGVPIRHRGRPVGNIYLANRPGRAEFSDPDEPAARVAPERHRPDARRRPALRRDRSSQGDEQRRPGALVSGHGRGDRSAGQPALDRSARFRWTSSRCGAL